MLRDRIGQNVFRCYQCVKCSAGCPVADHFDLMPNQVMRCLQVGDESVLESRVIWLCASCQTCSTRCPQDLDVAGVMDHLRVQARERGLAPAIPEVARFNELFLKGVKRFGRSHELSLMGAFNMARRQPFRDVGLGWEMFKRGKIKVLPSLARPPAHVAPVANAAGKIAYYPGCTLESAAREYDRTVRAVAAALDLDLVEPPGWVCCGSSPAHASDPILANVLPMQTINTVERMGLDTLTSPCSA